MVLAILLAAFGILFGAIALAVGHARRQARLEAEARQITQRMAAERARRWQ